jgi:hypothetical protein
MVRSFLTRLFDSVTLFFSWMIPIAAPLAAAVGRLWKAF